jgi:cephalosporin hydroxylase
MPSGLLKVRVFFASATRYALQAIKLSVSAPQLNADSIVDSFYKQIDAKSPRDSATSEVARLFYDHQGRLINKWDHYLDIYDRYFGPFLKIGRPVRLLELGVSHGGSLELWRKYFGPEAVILGIDVDPRCGKLDGSGIGVRIGSQADPEFLKGVVREMNGLDIVIDDGSHIASHQRKSFETLFPLLDAEGIYIVEDLHTAYFRGQFEGGVKRRGTFIEEVKALIDDMHGWYHEKRALFPDAIRHVSSIHVYDSIVIIEKKLKQRPFHTKVGKHSF